MKYKNVFKKFSQLTGCEHIASEFALKAIEKLVLNNRIKTVFEFGIGIGTIPYLIKSVDPNIYYVGTEDNDFCINQFTLNLGQMANHQFKHIKYLRDLDDNIQFDLIIVDGIFSDVSFLTKFTHKNSLIIVEGSRVEQREVLSKIFPNALVSRNITNKRNYQWSPFTPGNFMGGYTIYRLNSNSLINKIHHYKEKIVLLFLSILRKFT